MNLLYGVNRIEYRVKIIKLIMNCEMVNSGIFDLNGNFIKELSVIKGE